jgi:hypothetical protein
MGRGGRLRGQALGERHRDQVHRVFGQADRLLGCDAACAFAKLIDKIIREL